MNRFFAASYGLAGYIGAGAGLGGGQLMNLIIRAAAKKNIKKVAFCAGHTYINYRV
jgi:hypothetical protein